MQSIPGTEGLPPWAQLLGVVVFVVATAIGGALTKARAEKTEAKKLADTGQSAVNQAGAMLAMTPTASRMSEEALIQTLGSLKLAVEKLIEKLEEQEEEKEADEKAELRDLRRWRDELERRDR